MQILLAEDDDVTAGFVERGFAELGHVVFRVADGLDAVHLAVTEDFDAMVLDRMLPGCDGLTALRRVRAAGVSTPVILLTALGRIEDRVEGLDAGADDYLIKPFAFSELSARLNALRRRPPMNETVTRIEHGPLVADLLKREVRRDGRPILLQPREFRLIEELLRNADRVVTRTMLLERVWGYHFDPQTNIVDAHISRIRAKLNEGSLPDLIETVRGIGYRMRESG